MRRCLKFQGGGNSQSCALRSEGARHEALIIAEQFSHDLTARTESARTKKEQAEGKATSERWRLYNLGITYVLPRYHLGLTRLGQHVACMLMVLFMGIGNVWAANPETVDCSDATATSSTGNTNKSTSTNYTIYFTRGGGGWSVNSGKGYQGKTDAIAVFKLTASTDVKMILSNSGSSNRTFTAVAKPFETIALGDEFISILEYSNANTTKYADCVSESKNKAGLPTTSVFYNTAAATYCSLSNEQLSTTLSYTTGDQTLNASATKIEYGLGTLPAGVYAVGFSVVSNSNVSLAGFKFTLATSYTITYNANGGTGSMDNTTNTVAANGFTAPTGYKFASWNSKDDGSGDSYAVGGAVSGDITLYAQWVEDVPDPTATFADASYIIGASALDMSAKFTSNSEGSVTYSLKEATSNASITSAGSFTATVAGEYVVVASQAAVAGTYAAISKEATVTVLDNEVADTYIWKKGTGYTGCVANPNADAPAAQYTNIAYEGFTGMGRASSDNTECILTFTVKAAYSATFGIKSICTYGKFEESAGGQISWDGGTTWENLAVYSEGKKEFNAPAATFPTSFKIKFLGVSKDVGGLYWRNALVTLEVKKTVSGIVEELTNVKVNGTAIAAADLAALKTNKSLAIATPFGTAPTVTFVKQVTVSYSDGWADDVTSVETDVEASDNTTNWSVSQTINSQAYTVTLAKPAGPSLETAATSLTLTSAKIATDTESFTFSGVNLGTTDVTISLESSVAGMTVSPASVTPTAGAITDQEVTVTYKSLETVAAANVNLVVYYDADTKITIPLTYSSTAGVEDLTPISAATTWNWNGAADAAYGTLDQNEIIVLANADVTWDAGFNANAIAGALQYYYRDGKYAQGDKLKFNTTIPGKVFVTYSNTGGNAARTVNVNDVKGSLSTAGTNADNTKTESFVVAAGDVLIKGVQVSDDAAKMLRFYEVRFAPTFAVTYAAGDGAVKSGETLPTQADEAAGEKITLAAATILEKDGYDFAGWLCNIDAQTYQPGDEYTMTGAATTFTAQWVLHVDPVDPTLTYNEGAYMVGASALDLSTLIDASTSDGEITYTVKTDGGTSATIDGKNFTATAAGTATITASQAAVPGFNAITVDFDVVVTEATEIDGIKLVEAGALTGNFRIKADQLKTGSSTVEGINYTKYVQMGSTHTSFSGETEGNQTKGIYYAPTKKNIKFWFYMRNTDSSARKIYIYKMEEGSAVSFETVSVDNGSHLVSYDMTLSTNAEVIFGVENTKLYFCQIVAVESGDALLQGGQNGYVFDYSKKRQNVAANTVRTIDGIDYKLSAESKINSASNVQLQTLGTHYIKFHLDAPMTVNVYSDNKKYYIGSECSTEDAAKTYEATGNGEFSLAAGDWYINGSGEQVKINKLSFSAPKCEKPTITTQPATKLDFGAGAMTATVVASVEDGGTLSYQWYNAADDSEVTGATAATLSTTSEGTYYVIVTNTLADHSDNFVKSEEAQLGYRAMDDATLSALTVSAGTLAPAFDPEVLEYNVTLPEGTVDVPTLTATAAMATYGATAAVTGAAAFVNYEATSTVLVTAEDGTTKTYTVNFYVEHIITSLVDVTASTTWNWAGTTDATINDVPNKGTILANYIEGANFNKIEGKAGEYARRNQNGGVYQGTYLHFHTTVGGFVKFYFRAPSSGENCTITVKNNGKELVAGTRGNSLGWSKEVFVNGDVVIEMFNDKAGGGSTRVQQIVFTEHNVPDYTRAVSDKIGTLCVDHNVPAGAALGATFYQLAGKEPTYGKLVFDEVTELEAGEPYIFQSNTGSISLYYGETSVTEPVEVQGMIGSLANDNFTLEIDDDNKTSIMYISNNKLYDCSNLVGTGLTVVPNRCYIDYSKVDELAPGSSPAPGRRRITVGKDGQNTATGVESIQPSEISIQKVLINGQLFILRGEKMYDAKGQLVK